MISLLNRLQQVNVLRNVPLFNNLSKRQLNMVAQKTYQRTEPADKVLSRQGERGKEFLILLNGKARVEKNGRRAGTLSKGDHFGEIALIDGKSRTATVITQTEVELLGMSAQSFNQLLDKVPGLHKKITYSLCDYVRKAEGALSELWF